MRCWSRLWSYKIAVSNLWHGVVRIRPHRAECLPIIAVNISVQVEIAVGVLDGGDLEQLLVEFLDELLYLGESEELGCDRYRLTVEGTRLEAMVEGVPIVSQGKEIKAVTYHRLEVVETEDGLETRIVFDV